MLWIAGCAHALEVKVRQTILGATFGASAVLLYGVMESKLAQPRNVIGMLPSKASSYISPGPDCVNVSVHASGNILYTVQI